MTEMSRMAFVVSHEAWYWDAARDQTGGVVAEIGIQREPVNDDESRAGGVYWEFSLRWVDLYRHEHRHEHWRNDPPAPRLEMFNDSWQAFHEIPEFFGRLAALGQRASVEHVVDMLTGLGWVDATDRQSPYASPKEPTR